MNNKKKRLFKRKLILFVSFLFMLFSVYTQTKNMFEQEEYNFNYENVNINNMSPATVQYKGESDNILETIFMKLKNNFSLKEFSLITTKQDVKQTSEANTEPPFVWKLPTEIGTITQYPSYYHTALDLTSPRTYGEPIYSIARGTISSIYTDNAGGLTVTVLHNYNGVNITSQYIHFSRYADIYVGMPVTEHTVLGYMGSTGNSTGPHLHISVIDCGLYVPGDPNCYDLNSFFNYNKRRFNEGYRGIFEYIQVPYSWNSR